MLTKARLIELCLYDPDTGVFTWKVNRGICPTVGKIMGKIKPNGYRQICVDYKSYYASRLAFLYMMGRWPKAEMDHINGKRSDDRWINLREATRSQNVHRLHRAPRGKYFGVSQNPSGRWYARMQLHMKRVWLGCHTTPEEAARAYDAAAIKYQGEFARLNFPEEV